MTEQTDATIEQKTNEVEEIDRTSIKYFVSKAGTNPAQLEFPTDKWGFTSAIKREVLKQAATIKGQQDKTDLITCVLAVLLKHVQLRQAEDALNQPIRRERLRAAAEERAPRERIGAAVIDPTTVK